MIQTLNALNAIQDSTCLRMNVEKTVLQVIFKQNKKHVFFALKHAKLVNVITYLELLNSETDSKI